MNAENDVVAILNDALVATHTVELCSVAEEYLENSTDPALNEQGRNITKMLISEYQAEKATEAHKLISKSLNILQNANTE